MHLAERAYFLIALTALMAIAGIWSADRSLALAWAWPAGALLLGLAIESWWRRRFRFEAILRPSNALLLGRPAQMELSVREVAGRAACLEYARSLPVALAGDTSVEQLEIPAGGAVRQTWNVEPVRLGPGAFAPPAARLLGRWRLAWWQARMTWQADFAVGPDILGAQARRLAGNTRGDASRRLPGRGSELFQLRDYVPGDPLARIDWKASARRRALVSREFTEDQHLEIFVVMDAGRASRVRAGHLDRLGLYANVAARFAQHAVELDDRVGLVAYADRPLACLAPRRGIGGVRELRAALERMRTARAESRPLVAAAKVQRLARARSLIVWLCDFADPETAAELLRAVRSLRAKHFVIVANVEAREIERLASRPARNWRDPWTTIAAAERREAIATQTRQLRDRGALVLTASETQLEAKVLAAYVTQRGLRRV